MYCLNYVVYIATSIAFVLLQCNAKYISFERRLNHTKISGTGNSTKNLQEREFLREKEVIVEIFPTIFQALNKFSGIQYANNRFSNIKNSSTRFLKSKESIARLTKRSSETFRPITVSSIETQPPQIPAPYPNFFDDTPELFGPFKKDTNINPTFNEFYLNDEQSLIHTLASHTIDNEYCSFLEIEERTCHELINLSSTFREPLFINDKSTLIKSFMKSSYTEFYFNSQSLVDIWENYINADKKLEFEIVETTYNDLIDYIDAPTDPEFVLPKTSVDLSEPNATVTSAGEEGQKPESLHSYMSGVNRGPLQTDYTFIRREGSLIKDSGVSDQPTSKKTSFRPLLNTSVPTPDGWDIRPRIVFHAPSDVPTDILVEAMSNALPTALQNSNISSKGRNHSYALFKGTPNRPFGERISPEINATPKDKGLLPPPSPVKNASSAVENQPPTTSPPDEVRTSLSTEGETATPLYEDYQVPSSLMSSSQGFVVSEAEEDSIRMDEDAKDREELFNKNTKIVVRLNSPGEDVKREIEIPSSKFDENGIAELKLSNGKRLRIRIKKKKDGSFTFPLYNQPLDGSYSSYTPMNVSYPYYKTHVRHAARRPPYRKQQPSSSLQEPVKNQLHKIFNTIDSTQSFVGSSMSSAFESANKFLKNMFTDVNTYTYYDNLLTLIAFASFLGFLYSRSVSMVNSIAPLLAHGLYGKTDMVLTALQTGDGLLSRVVDAIEKWTGWELPNTRNDPFPIMSKRILKIEEDDTERESSNETTPFSGFKESFKDFSLSNQVEEAAKLSASLIDAAMQLKINGTSVSNPYCLARPLCELNKKSASLGGLSALVLPLIR